MAEQQDLTAATGTYEGFLKLFKWGAGVTAVVVTLVVLIIAS